MVATRLYRALVGLPLTEQQKVFVGVTTICAICAIPVLRPNRPKPGHGLFDSEKPQAVELAQEEARRKKLNVGNRT
ncbi:unnamed protein product [Ectocarpus sp. 4 AP-2014]